MDKELPKSELPKPFRKLSLRVSKSHLPGNTSYKGSVVWQRTLSIDDIAARVVDKRSEYRKETLITTFNLLKREIYDAIEEVKAAMEGMLSPEIKEEITGTAEVLQTYHISKVGTIAGCMVREGRIKRGSKVRLIRDGIVVYTGDLASLKRFKDDVKDVVAGYECGLSIAGYNDVRVGDMVEGFEEVEVKKTLSAANTPS